MFYKDLQELLELTPQNDVLFIIGGWNAKVGSQDTPRETGKFGLGALGTLDATHKVPRNPGLPREEH